MGLFGVEGVAAGHALTEPALARAQEPPADPIVARALEMGMDPELVQSLPRDMIEELLQNNQMWADNLGNPPPNQAQPAEAEMGIADMIAATGDPNLRREMLIQLSNDQAATLPEALRAERRQLVEGAHGGWQRLDFPREVLVRRLGALLGEARLDGEGDVARIAGGAGAGLRSGGSATRGRGRRCRTRTRRSGC